MALAGQPCRPPHTLPSRLARNNNEMAQLNLVNVLLIVNERWQLRGAHQPCVCALSKPTLLHHACDCLLHPHRPCLHARSRCIWCVAVLDGYAHVCFHVCVSMCWPRPFAIVLAFAQTGTTVSLRIQFRRSSEPDAHIHRSKQRHNFTRLGEASGLAGA